MNWEPILGMLGGGLGVFLLKAYADWHKTKRGDKKDVIGAWQEIADRETSRLQRFEEEQNSLKARVTVLEKMMLEKDFYIKQLEHIIIDAGLKLPKITELNDGRADT